MEFHDLATFPATLSTCTRNNHNIPVGLLVPDIPHAFLCALFISRGVVYVPSTQQTPRSYHLASTPAACYVTSVPTLPVHQTTKNTLRTPIGMPRPRRQQLTNGSSPVPLPDMSPGASSDWADASPNELEVNRVCTLMDAKVQQERLQVKRQRHVLKHRCSACGVTSDSTKAPMMACARCR